MKFIYILSENKELVEVFRVNSDRFFLIENLTNSTLKDYLKIGGLIPIVLDIFDLKRIISIYLQERGNIDSDIPDYEGRFLKEDVFENKEFEGQIITLCNTGSDNKIIFLINLYNDILKRLKTKEVYYLLLVNNHKEYCHYLSHLTQS